MCKRDCRQLPCNQTMFGGASWSELPYVPLLSDEPADPFVRTAWRAAADRSDAVRREAARFA